MRVFRSLLAVFLILIIVGGLGYIAWNSFMVPMNHSNTNTNPNNQAGRGQNQMPHGQNQGQQTPHGNTAQNNVSLNTISIQNRDKLNQAIGTINQALDMISIDPYSKTTLPQTNSGTMQMGTTGGQSSQGNGTINIYPSGNSSVNIAPNGNNTPNNQTAAANTNQGTANTQVNQNYVFDQSKLEQLHNGIFTLAQGVMLINQLNSDLLVQSTMVEANPPNNQTYIARYNTALQNKTKLNQAITFLSQASTLINVNPYASANGYAYNKDAMGQIHQGIYKLAQGMASLNGLNEDFTNQMTQASLVVQSINDPMAMTHGTSALAGVFGNLSLTTLFNIILIVLLAALIFGVLGAIMSMIGRKTNKKYDDGSPDNKPDII